MNELSVIYEDNHIIVVIKPQNMPVCADESGDEDLLNQIKKYLAEKKNPRSASEAVDGVDKASAYCGLVHRLDRPTGGVMVFAKTSKSAARLCEQIKDGIFQKTYLATVVGEPKLRAGTLVDHLLKNDARNTVEVVPSATAGAKRAELKYHVLETNKQVSLVEVKLITGRSHQARVQLKHLGCPIFGDAKYGGDKLGKGWNLALWAHELVFRHPTTEDMLKFIVNPPECVPWDSFVFDRKPKKRGAE